MVEVSITALGAVTRTDSAGNYAFLGLSPGLRVVHFRFPGYKPLSATVRLTAGQETRRDIVLQRAAVVLDSVRVIATRRRMARFEENRRTGLGHFFTHDDLEKQHVANLAQAMDWMASVRVQRGGGMHAWVSSSRPGRRAIKVDLGDFVRGAPPACYANVFVDGIQVYHGRDEEPLFDLNEIPVDEIEGVEYYSGPAETPIEYSSLDMSCGVLSVWTRRRS